ncbi:MAG: hypothetical protein C0179_01345 [Fervidicoccus sp.]|nr:MAG: hypothetical protein C0179_01345 [Fervidicoccus sp.]
MPTVKRFILYRYGEETRVEDFNEYLKSSRLSDYVPLAEFTVHVDDSGNHLCRVDVVYPRFFEDPLYNSRVILGTHSCPVLKLSLIIALKELYDALVTDLIRRIAEM